MEDILKSIKEKLEKSNQELTFIKNKIKIYETNNMLFNEKKDNIREKIEKINNEKNNIKTKISKIDKNINHYDNLIKNYNNNEKKIKNYIERII